MDQLLRFVNSSTVYTIYDRCYGFDHVVPKVAAAKGPSVANWATVATIGVTIIITLNLAEA